MQTKRNDFFFYIFLVFVSPNAIKNKKNENNLVVVLYCIFFIINKAKFDEFGDMREKLTITEHDYFFQILGNKLRKPANINFH